MDKKYITVEQKIHAPMSKVWEYWNDPRHIVNWDSASDDWESSNARNDLREGGRFSISMGAKDKSAGFEYSGVYSKIVPCKLLEWHIDDGRHVKVEFIEEKGGVRIIENFEPETENTEEKQREGWQAILDNFKKYTESR